MTNRVIFAVLVSAICWAPGCGRKKAPNSGSESAGPTATTGAPPGALADPKTLESSLAAPSKQGLIGLSSDENAYIRNSAKQALSSWDSKDYTSAVIALQKVVSVCQSASQREAALSSLAQLKQEIDTAAAKGNANAKEAAAQLAASGSQ